MTTTSADNQRTESEDNAASVDTAAVNPHKSEPGDNEQDLRGRRRLSGPRQWFAGLTQLTNRAATIAAVILALLLSAAVTTALVLSHNIFEHEATEQAARVARESAQTSIPAVLSYDFNSIDTEFAKAGGYLTGSFRDDFAKLASGVIIPAAHRDSIITKATVSESSVVSATADRVVLLVFLNQETTSSAYQGQRLDGSRIRVGMASVDGQWLISEITPL
ncbi:hypothetical protein ACIO14_24330 [Nocardia fluminea]|uniref:hypothetical protein n=1 Tax=Nocardia fluminea TaxID=134984 RepID=UPI003827F9A2